jgi:2-methylfumaryl-CoA isomerase
MGTDNPMFQKMDLPGLGEYPVPSSPISFEHSGANSTKRAPLLGEHTEEILSSVVGIADTEIAQLFDRGIVAGSPK